MLLIASWLRALQWWRGDGGCENFKRWKSDTLL